MTGLNNLHWITLHDVVLKFQPQPPHAKKEEDTFAAKTILDLKECLGEHKISI